MYALHPGEGAGDRDCDYGDRLWWQIYYDGGDDTTLDDINI